MADKCDVANTTIDENNIRHTKCKELGNIYWDKTFDYSECEIDSPVIITGFDNHLACKSKN